MAKKYVSRASVTAEPAEVADDQPQAEGLKPGRKGGRAGKSKTVRLTIDLPLDLEFRLDNVARTQRAHKGAFALRLIDQGLRSYKADASLKNVWAEICGQAAEAA